MNWTSKRILALTLICTLVFTSGCTSIFLRDVTKANGGRMNVTYPSVRYAGDALKHPSKLTPLILIDLPFSVTLDTVMLPFDGANSRKSKKLKLETDPKE
tara:strand:+ start:817 stop:1116 length:300 start_codon:yes stop_codon:yes gene_type:complete